MMNPPDMKTKPAGKNWKWGLFFDVHGYGEQYHAWFKYGQYNPGYYLRSVWS